MFQSCAVRYKVIGSVGAVAHRFAGELIEEIKEAFSVLDKDGRGLVATKELDIVVQSCAEHPTKAELWDMLYKVDPDGRGAFSLYDHADEPHRRRTARSSAAIYDCSEPATTPCWTLRTGV